MTQNQADFGFQKVDESQKAHLVGQVFDSVATRYDVMNDLMSVGMHRLWKMFALSRVGVRRGMKVLDIATGTADLASTMARKAGAQGEVWATDINLSMLGVGRDRLVDEGLLLPVAAC